MEENNNLAGAVETPPVAPTPPTIPPAPAQTPEMTPNTLEPIPAEPKSEKKLLPVVIVTSIIAVLGIIFGIFGLIKLIQVSNLKVQVKDSQGTITELDSSAIEKDGSSGTITIPDKTPPLGIDNDLAASIVKPYLYDIGPFQDILDRKITDNIKIKIAFENIPPQDMLLSEPSVFRVTYEDLNNMYKYLFGSEYDLEKKNYNSQEFVYTKGEDGISDYFLIYPSSVGGTGVTKFTAVKDAYFEGNKLIIEMYRKNLSWCGVVTQDPEVCVEAKTVYSDNDYEAKQAVIEKFGDKIEVRKMVFVVDNGHYILDEIIE